MPCSSRAEHSSAAKPALQKLRILLIDDNRDATLLLARLLELSGHEIQVTHEGAGGLAAARQMRPDVVLLDIGLPGASGYEVARQLRRFPECSSARLIAITGYGSERDRARALEAGFDHHLTKPISPDELNGILEGHFSS